MLCPTITDGAQRRQL